jgi:probable F420-dependent oxidoreductase
MRQLGKLGVWYPIDRLDAAGIKRLLRIVEDLGYSTFWYPEAVGYESLSIASFLLANAERLIIGSSIANIYARDPYTARRGLRTLSSLYDNRFVLGLGVSHAPAVEAAGHAYVKPYSKMVQFLDELPETAAPVVLAALGPKMLELSRDRTLGAHPYFTPPEHTAFSRSVLGPEPLLIPEQAVALAPGAAGTAAARDYAQRYLRLPNYTNNLKKFGFTDEDIAGAGSDRLISRVIPNGPQASVTRLREHLAAGADHVVVQLLAEGGTFDAAGLHALADLVADLKK